jgi:hypothetical protein
VYTIREDREIITLVEFLETLDVRIRDEASSLESDSLGLCRRWMLSKSNTREVLLTMVLARTLSALSWNSIMLTSGMRALNVIVLSDP